MTHDPLLEAILAPPDALPQALRAARRRRTVRHALTVSPVVIAGIAAALIAFNQPATPLAATAPPTPNPYKITTTTAHTIPVVHSSPTWKITSTPFAFTTVKTFPTAIPTITDDQLLALASTPGHPAALIHHAGQTQLLTTPQ